MSEDEKQEAYERYEQALADGMKMMALIEQHQAEMAVRCKQYNSELSAMATYLCTRYPVVVTLSNFGPDLKGVLELVFFYGYLVRESEDDLSVWEEALGDE